MILPAKSEERDRIAGLELGADDYVTKPFSAGELVLRVQAVPRRERSGLGRPSRKILFETVPGVVRRKRLSNKVLGLN